MVCVTIVAPLKNALDWASRGKNCWADKPAAIVSAGGGFGGGRSQYHLRQVGVFLGRPQCGCCLLLFLSDTG